MSLSTSQTFDSGALSGTYNTVAVTPGSTKKGDLLCVYLYLLYSGSSGAPPDPLWTAPAGFTQAGTTDLWYDSGSGVGMAQAMFYKVASGSESTLTFQNTGGLGSYSAADVSAVGCEVTGWVNVPTFQQTAKGHLVANATSHLSVAASALALPSTLSCAVIGVQCPGGDNAAPTLEYWAQGQANQLQCQSTHQHAGSRATIGVATGIADGASNNYYAQPGAFLGIGIIGAVFADVASGGGGGGTDPGGGWQDMKTSLNIIAGTKGLEAATCANVLAGLNRFGGAPQYGSPTMTKVQGVTATATPGHTTITATLSAATKGNLLYAACMVYGSLSDPGIQVPPGYADEDLGDTGVTNGTGGIWMRDVTKVAAGGETTVTFTLAGAGLFTKGIEVCVVELSGWTGTPVLDLFGASGIADATTTNPNLGTLAIPNSASFITPQRAVVVSCFACDQVLASVAGQWNPSAMDSLTTYASASGRLVLGWYSPAVPQAGDNYVTWTWTGQAPPGCVAAIDMLVFDNTGVTVPNALDLLGALNVWAGNGSNPANWRGLNGVANQLAGTKNLEANHAFAILAGLITT